MAKMQSRRIIPPLRPTITNVFCGGGAVGVVQMITPRLLHSTHGVMRGSIGNATGRRPLMV